MTAGSIDHIGIGVPDLASAKSYYDELMPIVGLTPWFPADDSQFNYGPDGAVGTQNFFYRALEPAGYSRHGVGLQHLSFSVPSRAIVHEAHRWAIGHDAEIVHEPRPFPQYGEDCFSTYFLDPHGIMLEVVCHAAPAHAGRKMLGRAIGSSEDDLACAAPSASGNTAGNVPLQRNQRVNRSVRSTLPTWVTHSSCIL